MSDIENVIRELIRDELQNPKTPEEARLIKGLSLEVMAAKAGTSKSTISRIERGVFVHPDAQLLEKLSRILECPAYALFAVRARDARNTRMTLQPLDSSKFKSFSPLLSN